MDLQEVWAYRARLIDDVTPVRVIRLGRRKPARVLVRFEDPALEGRQEWVPPARLKVPWSQAPAFRVEEARWAAVRLLAPSRDDVEARAVTDVFDLVVSEEVACLERSGGYLTITDVHALADLSGIPAAQLVSHPVAFEDETGNLIVPWPVALEIAQALAERYPEPILAAVSRWERRYQYEAIHGRNYADHRGQPGWRVPPESVRDVDAELFRPHRELLKSWCGSAARNRWDERDELRKEVRRVVEIAEEAIAALRTAGLVREARRLSARLSEGGFLDE